MPRTRRRICWPRPDKVCLAGGCLYCNDKPFQFLDNIRKHAEVIREMDAYRYGCVLRRGNAEFE